MMPRPRLSAVEKTPDPNTQVTEVFQTEICNALKRLLSTKHLYQRVDVEFERVKEQAKRQFDALEMQRAAMTMGFGPRSSGTALETFMQHLERWSFSSWQPDLSQATGTATEPSTTTIIFALPTVRTTCTEKGCEDEGKVVPFNPVHSQTYAATGLEPSTQSFLFTYQCQACKKGIVRFLVRRSGRKLWICGRDPMEHVEVPKEIPKGVRDHFSKAHIAFNAGQVLAGIFLLRVFVEQFLRSLPQVQAMLEAAPKASGDEIAAVYRSLLPVNFRDQFPSLGSVYQRLSDAMHTADANPEVFSRASGDIVLHFQAWNTFERSGSKLGDEAGSAASLSTPDVAESTS